MFKELEPMDEFFSSVYAEELLDSLRASGFEEIDSSIIIVAVREAMRLKNFCNTDEVPKDLYYLLYQMIIGSFLEETYASGRLPESFNFEFLGGRISLGDTSVELGKSSSANDPSEAKLLMWIGTLKASWREEAVICRKLKW